MAATRAAPTYPTKLMRTSGRALLNLGHQAVLFLPLLALLLLPIAALIPDQGHEVIENGITGYEWAYLVFVVAPLAFTALLHSVQMLRRTARIGSDSRRLMHLNTGRSFFYALLATVAGLVILAIPLLQFKLDEAECFRVATGEECRPGWPILKVAGYSSVLLLLPFIMHCRSAFSDKLSQCTARVARVWLHAPSLIQLLLLSLVSVLLAKDHSSFQDYGPVLIGAAAALLIARLPKHVSAGEATTNTGYWRQVRICIADAGPTISLAFLVLCVLGAWSVKAGELMGSLLVLYSGVLAWLVIVSLLWTCFLLLPCRLPVVGLCLLGVLLVAILNLVYGSFDVVRAVEPPVGLNATKPLSGSRGENSSPNSIADDFIAWSSPSKGADTPHTVVIVLAEGGGIRAAQWTNQMLFQFGAGNAEILRNTYAIVGVSGGALGATGYLANLAALYQYYVGHREVNRAVGEPTFVAYNNAQSALERDLMAPWLARVISLEGLHAAFPYDLMLSPSELLRELWGSYLTCAHEQLPPYLIPEYREVCNRLPSLVNAPIRSFPKAVGDRPLPRLIYTATHIESGTRVIQSSVDFSERDFPSAIDANQALGGSMSLLDAAYSSARFPGISRPGALIHQNGQVRGHVVDGGYLDGSGALTASDIIDAIARAKPGKVVPVVLDLNSNPDDDKAIEGEPNATVPSPARPVTEMYGLFKGVKQANGVRDLAAVAALRRQVCALGGGLLTLQVPQSAGPLALGWTLSQQATNRLTQARSRVVKSLASDADNQTNSLSLKDVYGLARKGCTSS